MKKIFIHDLDNLKAEKYFHFTLSDNLKSIDENGLKPQIGDNAYGIEKTAKTFFSKGELGLLKANEVFLRWLMNRIYGPRDILGLSSNLTEEERKNNLSEWLKEFIQGQYKKDNTKKEVLYEYFYEYLSIRTYLILNIKEGKHFIKDDIDENKVNLKNNNNILFPMAKVMYGEFSNMDSIEVDDWNMHTKSGVQIEKERIYQLVTKNGKSDALSVVMEIFDNITNKSEFQNNSEFLLNDFIKYAYKKKNQEMINGIFKLIDKEGKENDKNNYSRIY